MSKGIFSVFLSLSFLFSNGQDVILGEKLFKENCTSCHDINSVVTGPALKDVHKRRDEAWLLKWIKNSQAMVKSGDPQAVAIFNEYNGVMMNTFANFSDNDIKSILAYIAKESSAPAPTPGDGPKVAVDPKAPVSNGPSFYNQTTLLILVGIAFILAVIIFLLYKVRSAMLRMLAEKHPEEYGDQAGSWINDKFLPWWKKANKTVVTLNVIAVFLIIFGLYGYGYGWHEVGVQQGYAPTQPINFSHKLHAGDLQINCQYCHSTADKSKQASIPGANTCMNCHKYVDGSKITNADGTPKYNGKRSPEIQKIYSAINWDPEKKTYDESKPKTPIRWVRIHNLPDHAYFNHSQHVKVGKVQCQECHGKVEEMEKVTQFSTLQMGWCIDCHRQKQVDVAGNNYYEKLHKDMGEHNKKFITVAENGGLECSKCHY